MAVTLNQAKHNAQEDYDPFVIDEFRKESTIMDSLIFDDAVNPAGGGATLTYGYRRTKTQPTADTRAINSEYTPHEVETSQHSVNLAVMGGSFEVDRVLARVGPAASAAVNFQLTQKIKATVTRFQDEVINGATDFNANGFDGLNRALTGSSTEFGKGAVADWSALNTLELRLAALDKLDEFLMLMDGTPSVLVANKNTLARIRSIVRGTSLYVREPVEGLVGQNGLPVYREMYGGITFADAGDRAGTSDMIIPNETRNTKWKLTITATSGNYHVVVNGRKSAAIAYGADDAAIKAAIEGIEGVGEVAVASKVITFGRLVKADIDKGTLAHTTPTNLVATIAVESGGTAGSGVTDLYAYRVALDGFHGVSTVGGQLVRTWLPDFTTAGAVKKGEVELGPVAVALKATKAAAVFRNIKI